MNAQSRVDKSRMKYPQLERLCEDFLSFLVGKELDAYDARLIMYHRWGIKIDHHEFAYALDRMSHDGRATLTQPGGVQRYRINEPEEKER